MPARFHDLSSLPEEDRIGEIFKLAKAGQLVGVLVEDEKVDRYIAKLASRGVTLMDRTAAPSPPGVMLLRFFCPQ